MVVSACTELIEHKIERLLQRQQPAGKANCSVPAKARRLEVWARPLYIYVYIYMFIYLSIHSLINVLIDLFVYLSIFPAVFIFFWWIAQQFPHLWVDSVMSIHGEKTIEFIKPDVWWIKTNGTIATTKFFRKYGFVVCWKSTGILLNCCTSKVYPYFSKLYTLYEHGR